MKGVYKALIIMAAVLIFTAAAVFISLKIFYPVKYRAEVNAYAKSFGFPPALIFAVIRTESGFDDKAVSGVGAMGLMQLMPQTAAFISEKAGYSDFETKDLYEPSVNILLGCAYLRYLADKFGDTELTLYAYNAGEGNVAAWLINPEFSKDGKTLYKIPFKETERYYKKVIRAKKVYGFINCSNR